MVLAALIGNLLERFSYELVQFKRFCLPVKSTCSPADSREFKKPGRDTEDNVDKKKINLHLTFDSRETLKSFSFLETG